MNLTALVAGLLPVLLFLFGLVMMDSYKLVARRLVVRAIAWGMLAALIAFALNVALLNRAHIPPELLKRYIAPVLEESLKAAFIVWLLRRDRIGFMVDAGIQGFAVGAGFALVENLYYANVLADPNVLLWLVRGLGTAVMHGCTTAIAGILAKDLCDRHRTHALPWMLPGLALAITVHSAFNHLALQPLASVATLLIGMPLLLVGVFERSERATRDWLGTGLDADVETLELILSGELTDTRIGQYLESLRAHFPGAVVADMLCLVQIHLELALRAKGILIARQAGVDLPVDHEIRANFAEMKYLEKTIGPTGRAAILPLMRGHSRDLWQVHMMRGS